MKINEYLLIGLFGLFTVGSNLAVHLYRAYGGDRTIWWTARTLPLNLDETKDVFELRIRSKPLQTHLAEGTLSVVNEEGIGEPVVSGDVAVRVNNWERVKASILANALLSGFLFGASVALLIAGICRSLSGRSAFKRSASRLIENRLKSKRPVHRRRLSRNSLGASTRGLPKSALRA
jgi:hypothetical protein